MKHPLQMYEKLSSKRKLRISKLVTNNVTITIHCWKLSESNKHKNMFVLSFGTFILLMYNKDQNRETLFRNDRPLTNRKSNYLGPWGSCWCCWPPPTSCPHSSSSSSSHCRPGRRSWSSRDVWCKHPIHKLTCLVQVNHSVRVGWGKRYSSPLVGWNHRQTSLSMGETNDDRST